jgi:hypothetical protein
MSRRSSYQRNQSEKYQTNDSDRTSLRSFYSRRSRQNVMSTSEKNKDHDESENGWLGYPPTLAIPELQSVTSGSTNLTDADSHFEKPPPVSVVYPTPPSNNHHGGMPSSTTSERHLYASTSSANPPLEPYRYSRAPANIQPPFEPSYKHQQRPPPSESIRTSFRSTQTGYYSYDADFSAYMTPTPQQRSTPLYGVFYDDDYDCYGHRLGH